MSTNLREISRELGLSTATVSRVLNNKPDVGDSTRGRVLRHLKEKGYALPGSEGLSLVGVVGGFSRDHFSYYFAEILQGIEPELSRNGANPVILRSGDLLREFREYGQVPLLSRLKGLIWIMPELDGPCRDMILAHNLPCVCINSCGFTPGKKDPAILESDNERAARESVEYLWGLGHRNIAFLGTENSNKSLRVRREICREALEERGGYRKGFFINDLIQLTPQSGRDGTARLMTGEIRPTAIIVSSDHLVPGVYKGLAQMGYSIPGNVSVVAFDDFAYSDYLSPPLTTFRQPMEEMGLQAARMLTGEPSPAGERLLKRMPFMVRESAGPPEEHEGNL